MPRTSISFPREGASARADDQPQAASSQGDAAGARPAVVSILFGAVVTNRLHELALKKEYAHIQSELRQAVHRDSFALFPEWGVTVKTLIARTDQLLFTPTLSGTVRAQFLIGIDGRVASATATGLGDAVNFCVAAVIRGLVFPSSDSRVLVNYPLYLRLVRRPHGHRGMTPALQVGVPAVGRLPGQPGGT